MEQKNQTQTPQTDATEVTMTELEKALTAENEKLISQVEELTAEKEKLAKTVQRLQSSADKSDTYLTQLVAMKNDFESYKRRMKFNGDQAKAEGITQVVTKLMEICDNFELASKHLEGDNLKAFQMIHQQFVQTLASFNVVEMDVIGKDFDCMTMEALSQMDRGEENKGKVVEVYKNGYAMGDKVLRYAQVIVGA